jgi:CRP/FNR family transcriptional regulator, cyclic AMP receptor protein
MSKLEKLLSQYAAYHLDHKNIVTHFVGIPLIVFSIMCLTARAGMAVGSFEITLAVVLILASIVYYLSVDRIFGVIMLVIYAMAYPLAYKIAQFDLGLWLSLSIGIFVVGWAFQFVDIEGKEAVAAIAEPIMWFGEISLIDQQPRSHDAIAIQKSTLLHLPKRDVEEFIQATPEFWFHIAQLASQKLRLAFLELIAIQSQNISQRLAQRLLFILSGYGNHLSITNDEIHLSQEQLAQMLMSSRQTINQELQNLEKQGILAIAFKKIKILDPAMLHKMAHSSE